MHSKRFLVSCGLALATTGLWAQEKTVTAPAPAAPVSAPAAKLQPQVFPNASIGGDFRVRYEAYNNAQTLSSAAAFSNRDYFRVRLRAWETVNAAPGLTYFGRISAEPRYWFNAATTAGEGLEWKYALFDNLNAKWTTDTLLAPLTLTFGRQDIQLGDQWLVGDGTPLDGSWTNHFDALRIVLDASSIKTKFDLSAFAQQAHPGDTLPMLGRKGTAAVTEQDEIGVVLYASNKSLKNTQIDGYFIYKGDSKVTGAGDDADIYTFGAKVSGTPAAGWLYSAEGAFQCGRRRLAVTNPRPVTGYRDILAYGFNAKLTYLFKGAMSNQVGLLAEYLSGDESGTTGKDEMFDVLWGRYPRVGETWAAAYPAETSGRTAQYNNLARLGATWSMAPTKLTSIAATYCALFAPQATATRATNISRFSGDGNFRGHMIQVVAKQKFTTDLSGLLFAEVSTLGDYYTNKDTITFLRAEVTFTF